MFSDRKLETKRNNFEALRLFLAVLVLFSHCYPLTGGRTRHDPLDAATFGRWTLGTLAVDAFLAISGFLVAASLERSASIANFLLKRVRRVYPGFVVLMLLQAFVVAPVFAASYHPYTASQLLRIAVEIADLVSYGFPYGGLLDPFASNPFPHELNGSLWTIRYEFVCYGLLAGLALAGQAKRRWVVALIACLSITITLLVVHGLAFPWSKALTALLGVPGPLLRFMGFFFSGVTFYQFRARLRFPLLVVAPIAVLTVASLFFGDAAHVILPTFGVYLILGVALQTRVHVDVKGIDISYGFYLYAFPIQQMLVCAFHGKLDPLALFALAAPLTATAAALSWHFVERPFLRGRLARQAAPAEN